MWYNDTANRLLTLDPIHEATHRNLMTLHLRAGRKEGAIQQYDLCAETLRCELDISPDGETKALHEAIVARRNEPISPALVLFDRNRGPWSGAVHHRHEIFSTQYQGGRGDDRGHDGAMGAPQWH